MNLDKTHMKGPSILSCASILDCHKQRRFAPGEMIYTMGDNQDGVWQVLDGYVGLRVYTLSGEVVLLRLVNRRGLFGSRSFLTDKPRSCCAQAISPVTLRHLPASQLNRMMEREPGFEHALLLTMAEAFRDAHDRILSISVYSARTRFLRLCAEWAADEGIETPPAGFSVRLPIPYQDIAQILSISPETMSRTVHRLHEDGVITMAGRHITISAGWIACCETETSGGPIEKRLPRSGSYPKNMLLFG